MQPFSRAVTGLSQQLVLLIPCFNEAARVGPVIQAAKRVLPEAAVVVIDDASCDNTASVARNEGALVLSHSSNLGYGAALETGYLFAAKHGYDVLLQMDGDGQHLAEELPARLKPIVDGSADIVIGSRYIGGGSAELRIPVVRRFGHRLFSSLVRLCCGLHIEDPTSGFQAMTRRAFTFFADSGFPCDYPDSDVIVMATLAGLRIREVPARMRAREGGVSMHSGLKPIYYGFKMLLSIFIVLLNRRLWKDVANDEH